jgi:hypothetical protein
VLHLVPDALDDDQLGETGGPAPDGEVDVGLPAAPEARDEAVRPDGP